MKVLICGDRNWTNEKLVHDEIDKLPPETIILEGGATGADRIAAAYGRSQGHLISTFPANWRGYRKAAGPIRNIQMLDEGPDLVIAFHNDLENSKGTKHCVTHARKRGIQVRVVTE